VYNYEANIIGNKSIELSLYIELLSFITVM